MTFPRDVDPTEFEGINARFFCQHIDERFTAGIRLGRTVGTIGGTEGMVGVGNAGQTSHMGDIIGEEGEARRFGHHVVAAPGVCAVVQTDIKLTGGDVPILVAAQAAVGVGRAAFAGEMLVFFIRHGQSHRGLHNDSCRAGQAQVARVGGPTEGSAGGVHDDTHFFFGNAQRVTNTRQSRIHALGFALEGEHAVFVKVGLNRIAFDGQMGLTGGVEATFHVEVGAFNHVPNFGGIFQSDTFQDRLFRKDIGRFFMDADGVGHDRIQIRQVFR